MTKYDAVLFDVDGTLIHSAPGILATLEYTFAAMNIDCSNVDLTQYLGPPLRDSFALHCKAESDVERMVDIYRERYKQVGQHQCSVYPGVFEMLNALKKADIGLYTATSKPTLVVTPILEQQKLDSYFEFIGGASQDNSVDTKTAVIQQVLGRSELQGKQVLMVGDRHHDMQGAANCSLAAAAVLYGYGSKQELQPFSPVILADTCEQLTHYILNLRKS